VVPTFRSIIRFLCLCLSVMLFASFALAQEATVVRNVNLRSDPSTANPPIRLLSPPEKLTLFDLETTSGYYHVKTQDGVEGWVWGKNLQVLAPGTISTVGTTAGGTSTAASAISSDWDKPDPRGSVFHGQEGDCQPGGDGGDSITNPRKNRIDVPDSYHSVTWDAMNNLDYPKNAPRSLDKWTDTQLAAITPVQGVAVSVEGFLVKVKVETSSPNSKGGESTNCHFHRAPDVDWHMPLTAHAGDGENLAIIVETTPRIRAQHANWTVQNLKPWTGTGQEVRISGWLMLDPEHQDMINSGLRSTLWEVHPVTKIEVFKDGQWVDLDNLQ
jgi:uncharacterized protein YraI